MKLRYFTSIHTSSAAVRHVASSFVAYSGAASRDSIQAKQAAEAKGSIFENSHDEIVAKAKKRGGYGF
ncbi:MAG: hypothetical protein ACREQW_24430 [Candidatus Binatia bacterium]